MINYFNLPLLANLETWQIIIFIIAGGIILFIALFIIILLLKKNKKKTYDGDAWFVALGGKENIKEISATGSRLSLALINKDLIDREQLKNLGVSSVLTMSNKVTLVIEGEAEAIAEAIKNSL